MIYSDDLIPSIAEIKLPKYLRVGVIQTSIYLDALTGWAGLTFLVMEKKNYYMLELGAECKIAKVVDGEREFIKKNAEC